MSEDTMTVDESPQSITDVKKKRRRRLVYLAIAVVLWYLISYVVLTEEPFIYGKVPGFYWLALHQVGVTVVAIVAPVAAIVVLLLIPRFIRTKKPGYLLIAFALVLPLWMCLTLVAPVISRLNHIQTLRYDDRIYYLADRIPFGSRMIIADACLPPDPADYDPDCYPGYFTHEYFVYRCGQLGVMCQGIGYEAFDEHKYASEGELSVNAEGTIILEVRGLWVWEYPNS